ncbi:hypothetical protein NE237_000220 [Protea cynaroides]|uniref:Uncharacterized protein n=1 Tax=Protea cynaroides TaxID=273540 RepID=A0A9Q0KRS1_9MAGN|nr:hypothetical protein NE237_000220 [Protea cynaroides]
MELNGEGDLVKFTCSVTQEILEPMVGMGKKRKGEVENVYVSVSAAGDSLKKFFPVDSCLALGSISCHFYYCICRDCLQVQLAQGKKLVNKNSLLYISID